MTQPRVDRAAFEGMERAYALQSAVTAATRSRRERNGLDGLDDHVAGSAQLGFQQCGTGGTRIRSEEDRRMGCSLEGSPRAAPEAPRSGLRSRRSDQVGLVSRGQS